MKKNKIILIARPDHSMMIYSALLAQEKISFIFYTFGVLKKNFSFLQLKRIRYVSSYCRILKYFTIMHFLKYHKKIQGINEYKIFNSKIKKLIRKRNSEIVHYWPSYCWEAMSEYKRRNPNAILLAEMYMPNPVVIEDIVKNIYNKYRLKLENSYVHRYAQVIDKHFSSADYIVVPSSFVKETMMSTFPNAKYILNSYGVNKTKYYKTRFLEKGSNVKNFVYIGGVNLEKGCDILLSTFEMLPHLNLHLFGKINEVQKSIFAPYLNKKNIFFHGSVSKEELFYQMQYYDVGIHLSQFDAYSLAVAEEVGSGLPVLVSQRTGIKDDIMKFDLGIVVDIDNQGCVLNSIMQITDTKVYNNKAAQVAKYVNSTNNVTYGQSMIEIYNGLLHGIYIDESLVTD